VAGAAGLCLPGASRPWGRGAVLFTPASTEAAGHHAGPRRRRHDRRELLVAPGSAIELSEHLGALNVASLIGFLLGAVVLRIVDRLLPTSSGLSGRRPAGRLQLHGGGARCWSWRHAAQHPRKVWRWRAFGAAGDRSERRDAGRAVMWRWASAWQNFPEGLAVAMPLRREGLSRGRALWYGQSPDRRADRGGVGAPPWFKWPNRSFLTPGVCGRRDDLRRCGGADSRRHSRKGNVDWPPWGSSWVSPS